MTNWRDIGDVDIGIWRRTLHDARSPLEAVATESYIAASPHTALALAMLRVESQFGVAFNANSPSNLNYLNLRPQDADGYVRFDSAVEGIQTWRDRITSLTYKNGIYANTVTIADLIHVFAPSSDGNNEQSYVRSIEADLARWGVVPTEVTPMSTPTIYDLATDYARFGLDMADASEVLSHRFDNRNGISPQFIVLHIQAGYTKGSLEYWANTAQASSTVMAQHDGSILKVIPEQHGPWTNGDDAQPSANGARLVNLPGNSNLYTLSIEAEGVDGSDTTAAQLDSIVWQVETWMAKYGIPKTNVLRHADINSVTRPNCPGAYYPKVMARIGETPVPIPTPEPPKPAPITWEVGESGVIDYHGTKVYSLVAEVTCKRLTTPRIAASTKAKTTGPKIEPDEKVTVVGTLDSPWYIVAREDGTYPRVSRTAFYPSLPRPRDAA